MIWDCFPFGGAYELDMLECRLATMAAWPGIRHVICEATVTFQGTAKPLAYREHAARFARWADRIIYLAGDLAAAGAHAREAEQREFARRALAGAGPGDVVLASDTDEIPNAAGIAAARCPAAAGTVLVMTGCSFAVDWLWPAPWPASVAVPAAALTTLRAARERGTRSAVTGAGHHLSWLGGPAAVAAKMAATAHTEVHTAALLDVWERGGVPFPAWERRPLIPADVDESWPGYVWRRQCPPSWFRPRNQGG